MALNVYSIVYVCVKHFHFCGIFFFTIIVKYNFPEHNRQIWKQMFWELFKNTLG